MKKLIVLISLLSSLNAFADGAFFRYGVGVFVPSDTNDWEKIGNVKMFSLGVQGPFFYLFEYQLEGGLFNDSKTNEGRNSSFFTDASLGVSSYVGYFYSKVFFGLAAISDPDSLLSSVYQFNNDLEFGIKDNRGVCVGIGFKHLSNAGLHLPNIGRQWGLVKVQIPL